jgi:hypothetical protein
MVAYSPAARQGPANNNRGIVFPTQSVKHQLYSNIGTGFPVLSVPKYYKQDNCSNELSSEEQGVRSSE